MNTPREPQDMEGESDIDTTSDSESESEWNPESSTGSDSLNENDRTEAKKGQKRKLKKTSSLCTPKKSQVEDSRQLRQKFGNKSELPVTCGDKNGILHVEKYNDNPSSVECILSEDQWFKPNEFERFGGKGRSKKWKTTIFCDKYSLQKFIEAGLLSPLKKRRIQNKQIDSPDPSPVADRLRNRKRQLFPSCSESNTSNHDNNDSADNDDKDITDMTMFEVQILPVTCGSGSGILHKNRFATGRCGRCIRTEDFWLTPEDFIRLNKPDGMWRKDILSSGIPLGKLIMKRVLELHMITCDCRLCEDLDQDLLNDDMCYVCDSEEELLCCDECPRAFHSHCHLPAVHKDSLGSQWSCTFCVMKKMDGSNQKTLQHVLSSPVSQYTLHCQYLLLHLLHESKVPGFSENIFDLGRMKLKLEKNDYQTLQEFVTDIELVCNNCCTSSEGSNSSRMTSKLKEVFKREFETIFKLL
ncbi:nuclear body protein SP140-like protein isoform X1 [Carassius gibelio]|uniref:nuclear body protein SP140-like protein isoform X1 n=1 Tax=Carassius gibelio TaxID=101364 RepID=UPI002278450C|nr:nuclear body protein SP140-like protein isoform X1 [Carassius gibelio]